MKKTLFAFALATGLLAAATASQAAGNLAAVPATRLELGITGATPVLSVNTFELETGKYYRFTVTDDGQAEVMFRAPEFLRNIWLNQVVIGGIEVHLQGMSFYGIEFDAAGTAYFAFVPIRPGEYPFTIEMGGNAVGTGTFIVR